MTARLLGAILLVFVALPAFALDAVLYMGLGDGLFAAHLQALATEMRRCGATVTIRPWWSPASGRFDAAIGQSAGTKPLDVTDAGVKIALDPTARFHPEKPVTRSYYTDGIGVRLAHSPNVYVPQAGHIALPGVVEAELIRLLFNGRCRRSATIDERPAVALWRHSEIPPCCRPN